MWSTFDYSELSFVCSSHLVLQIRCNSPLKAHRDENLTTKIPKNLLIEHATIRYCISPHPTHRGILARSINPSAKHVRLIIYGVRSENPLQPVKGG